MSKSFYVFETPTCCAECPLRYDAGDIPVEDFTYRTLFRCKGEPEEIEDVYLKDILYSKPEWCPLKEVPEKQNDADIYDEYSSGWELGWNRCIKYMLGEDNE